MDEWKKLFEFICLSEFYLVGREEMKIIISVLADTIEKSSCQNRVLFVCLSLFWGVWEKFSASTREV
jgi:hypothetical protein